MRLNDTTSNGNPDAWGARVQVTPGAGRPTDGWIVSNGSFETQAPPELHVGLGSSKAPVEVTVWWPGASEPTTYLDVAIDTVVTLSR